MLSLIDCRLLQVEADLRRPVEAVRTAATHRPEDGNQNRAGEHGRRPAPGRRRTAASSPGATRHRLVVARAASRPAQTERRHLQVEQVNGGKEVECICNAHDWPF